MCDLGLAVLTAEYVVVVGSLRKPTALHSFFVLEQDQCQRPHLTHHRSCTVAHAQRDGRTLSHVVMYTVVVVSRYPGVTTCTKQCVGILTCGINLGKQYTRMIADPQSTHVHSPFCSRCAL